LNPATIAASEPTVWLRCPSDWHRSLRPAPAARSALRRFHRDHELASMTVIGAPFRRLIR
jgi:hypothetical protein